MFEDSPHLPFMIKKLIPMDTIFNKNLIDLRTPKWSHLGNAARIVLRLFLQWRLNTKSEVLGSPMCSVESLKLSGNHKFFANEGCYWLKQVLV